MSYRRGADHEFESSTLLKLLLAEAERTVLSEWRPSEPTIDLQTAVAQKPSWDDAKRWRMQGRDLLSTIVVACRSKWNSIWLRYCSPPIVSSAGFDLLRRISEQWQPNFWLRWRFLSWVASAIPIICSRLQGFRVFEATNLGSALAACRGAFRSIALFSGLSNVLMLTGSFFMLQIYDRVLPSRSVPTLIGLAIIAVMLYVFQGVIDLVRSRMSARIGRFLDLSLARPGLSRDRAHAAQGAR